MSAKEVSLGHQMSDPVSVSVTLWVCPGAGMTDSEAAEALGAWLKSQRGLSIGNRCALVSVEGLPFGDDSPGAARSYMSYVVGRRLFFRRASVVMACVSFNALQGDDDGHRFNASWTRTWFGAYRMELREEFPQSTR